MNIATFVDVIDAYPKPCRLAFYLTLEIVNINLARSFPYEDFFPYKDDIESMGEKLMNGAKIETLEPYADLLSMDMRLLLGLVESALEDSVNGKSNNPMEYALGCANMVFAIECILKEFHNIPVSDIEKALKKQKIKDGLIYFKELEVIADRVSKEILNNMMEKMTK